jgi:hypothetical protein
VCGSRVLGKKEITEKKRKARKEISRTRSLTLKEKPYKGKDHNRKDGRGGRTE